MAVGRVDDARAMAAEEIVKWAAATGFLFLAVRWLDGQLCVADFKGIAKC